MKKTLNLLALLLLLSPVVSFAQDETDKIFDRVKVYNKSAQQPTYVLKVDDKTLVFNSEKYEKVNFDSIDPNSIKEIQVLKGEAAAAYNDNNHGVVIITFKNFEDLSPTLKKKFEAL
jgi:outer membrane receptor protein involved in Fe transport